MDVSSAIALSSVLMDGPGRTGLGTANEGLTLMLEIGSLQNCSSRSKFDGQSREREGVHVHIMLGEGTVYLGSQSTLAYILDNKSGADQPQALLKEISYPY
ncbi:hypothetical protein BJX63DRAFT_380870 [Aspergillus granulosus]|uniref:Uncharacterized protein n=1 Tax=Aspergillus granulosus TaxID=176169 RepID=A0ABR4HWU2_9EURO